MANVNFYRGTKSLYKASEKHKDALYFATDTKELLLNGVAYGGDIKDVTYNADTFTLTVVKSSGNSTINLSNLKKFYTQLPNTLATPVKIGGLKAGTTVEVLKTKSLSQVLEDILFEELQPTVNNPSVTLSVNSPFAVGGIYEVGAAAPQVANFTVNFNRGLCTVPGQPNKNRAGAETSRAITKYDGQALGAKIVLNENKYKVVLNYAVGDTLLTSKGNKASVNPNPLPAGSVTGVMSIFGTYPYFCNGASASTSAGDSNLPSAPVGKIKLPLQKWTDTLIGAKFASEAASGTRLVFKFPSTKNVTKVEFYNTVSGKWEVFGVDKYAISAADNESINGATVAYKKLTTTGSLSGALQLRFTVADVAPATLDEEPTYDGEPITDEVIARLAKNSVTVPFIPVVSEIVDAADRDLSRAATGNRPAGVASFAVNFEPGGQTPLDARALVPTKADLINAATYSAKNYYKGMMVVVADELAIYILTDPAKITSSDYSGWKRMDAGAAVAVRIINDLTTGGTTSALSAEQGKVLKGMVDAVKANTINGKRIDSNPTLSGVDIKLTGYAKGASYTAIAATDTTNAAIGKLEKRTDDLYSAVAGKLDANKLGQANGAASLDGNGKVPASQLPGFVDDVVEWQRGIVASFSALPTTGLTVGEQAYATAEKKVYTATSPTTWDSGYTPAGGKIYIAIPTNKSYRWSGTTIVELNTSVALGETSSTAYAGDKGKANRDALNSLYGKLITQIDAPKADADKIVIGYAAQTKTPGQLNYGNPTPAAINITSATPTAAGLMSAADKKKLDDVEKNYQIPNEIFDDTSTGEIILKGLELTFGKGKAGDLAKIVLSKKPVRFSLILVTTDNWVTIYDGLNISCIKNSSSGFTTVSIGYFDCMMGGLRTLLFNMNGLDNVTSITDVKHAYYPITPTWKEEA